MVPLLKALAEFVTEKIMMVLYDLRQYKPHTSLACFSVDTSRASRHHLSPNTLLVNIHTKLVHEYFTPSFTKSHNYVMTWLKGSKANTRSTNSLVHGTMNNKS
jgi:hypothetical protein